MWGGSHHYTHLSFMQSSIIVWECVFYTYKSGVACEILTLRIPSESPGAATIVISCGSKALWPQQCRLRVAAWEKHMATVENVESSQAQGNQQTCERLHFIHCLFGQVLDQAKARLVERLLATTWTRLVNGDRDHDDDDDDDDVFP